MVYGVNLVGGFTAFIINKLTPVTQIYYALAGTRHT